MAGDVIESDVNGQAGDREFGEPHKSGRAVVG